MCEFSDGTGGVESAVTCTQVTPSGDFIPKEFVRVFKFAFVSPGPWVSRLSLACLTLQAHTLLTISLVICTNPID